MKDNLKGKKLLVIVESPTKATKIQKYLKEAGYNAKVYASKGHIMKLADGGDYYNSGISPDKNFELNLKIDDEHTKIVSTLKQEVKNADLVVLMTDADREGYVISWSLMKFLKIPKSKAIRAVTHEITPKAVVYAIENPIQLNENLVSAGLARLTIDKMIGYRLSPIAKTYVGAKSVGRCQSVGLKLVADREKEIQNFVPETYYNLFLNFSKNKTNFKAKYFGYKDKQVKRIENLDQLKDIQTHCTKDYTIESITNKIREESPKPPFETLTFQQEAANRLNLKVKDIMNIAQSLFEGGFISYHRTASSDMAPEFIDILKPYIEKTFGKTKWNKPKEAKKATIDDENSGHECLRITDPALTPEEFAKKDANILHGKVYKLIWQRTIASTLPNAKFSETVYKIDNNGEKFILNSKELIDPGYKQVYSADTDEKEEIVKETFSKGEKLNIIETKNTKEVKLSNGLSYEKRETLPPPRFTESSLVKKLSDIHVGRPATTSTIIETVLSQSRGYATLENKYIVPTERGMQLAAFLDRNFNNIIKTTYTAELEEDLDKIANGKENNLDFLNRFYKTLEDTIKNSSEIKNSFAGKEAGKTCPLCGAPMVIRRSRFGKLFYGCSKFPNCHGIINIDQKDSL